MGQLLGAYAGGVQDIGGERFFQRSGQPEALGEGVLAKSGAAGAVAEGGIGYRVAVDEGLVAVVHLVRGDGKIDDVVGANLRADALLPGGSVLVDGLFGKLASVFIDVHRDAVIAVAGGCVAQKNVCVDADGAASRRDKGDDGILRIARVHQVVPDGAPVFAAEIVIAEAVGLIGHSGEFETVGGEIPEAVGAVGGAVFLGENYRHVELRHDGLAPDRSRDIAERRRGIAFGLLHADRDGGVGERALSGDEDELVFLRQTRIGPCGQGALDGDGNGNGRAERNDFVRYCVSGGGDGVCRLVICGHGLRAAGGKEHGDHDKTEHESKKLSRCFHEFVPLLDFVGPEPCGGHSAAGSAMLT